MRLPVARVVSRGGLFAAALVGTLLAVAVPASAAWRTTSFEVYRGDPHAAMRGWEAIEAVTPQNPLLLRDVYVREIENYLFAVAERYAALGFPDPIAAGVLHSLVTRDDGEEAIRIYLSTAELSRANRNAKAWYVAQPCGRGGSRGLIYLNMTNQNFATGRRLNDSDYVTLAHELFHAVHQGTANGRTWGCRFDQRWFSEGMADAIGTHMARTLRNTRFEKELAGTGYLQVFGNRYYSFPLSLPVEQEGAGAQDYYTSSFWRHLAEWSHASRQGKPHPGSAAQHEDYSYLVALLGEEYSDGVHGEGLITWLDRAMRRNPRIRAGLSGVFPQFVATQGHIVETRIRPLGLAPSEADLWLPRTFGTCSDAGAVGPGSSHAVPVSIRPNSARCLSVNVQPDVTHREVALQVTGNDRELLDQLFVARLDGTDVRPPLIRSRAGGQPPHVATWYFPIVRFGADRFVLSNVADHPAATRSFDGEFHLTTGTFSSSAMEGPLPPLPGPQPLPPGPYPPARGEHPPTQRELQRAMHQQVVAAPLEHLQTLTKVQRQAPDDGRASCDTARLQLNLCGPQLRITLELSPFASLRALAGSGHMGEVDAVIGAGTIDEVDGSGFTGRFLAAIQETEAALAARDGAQIRIALPRVDYGFTGTKSNAVIEVSKANSPDRGYVAYGPAVQAGGQIVHRPPNGSVTIEEYSLHVLRGSFRAELVDESNPGRSQAPIVARSISGRFEVPSPVTGDKDFVIDSEHQKRVLLESMLRQTPLGAEAVRGLIENQGGPPQALCDLGVDDDVLLAMGFTIGCGAATGQVCSCECALRAEEKDSCAPHCAREWRQCPSGEAQLGGGMAEEVAHYRSLMQARGLPLEMQNVMIEQYKKMPEWQRKLTIQGYQ